MTLPTLKKTTEAEIYAAIKETPAEKSPGPDGYIGAFYKLFWDTIKGDLTAAIREKFLTSGKAAGICLTLQMWPSYLRKRAHKQSQIIAPLASCTASQSCWERYYLTAYPHT
jgi:hypothetical protein